VRLKNALAPDWLKLGETSDSIIGLITATIRRLEKLAVHIGEPGAVEKFKKEFDKLEAGVAELADQYWWIRKFLASSAGVASQPEPEQEYDAELERRGWWPPEGKKEDSDDVPF
jgi:hypothetical protein